MFFLQSYKSQLERFTLDIWIFAVFHHLSSSLSSLLSNELLWTKFFFFFIWCSTKWVVLYIFWKCLFWCVVLCVTLHACSYLYSWGVFFTLLHHHRRRRIYPGITIVENVNMKKWLPSLRLDGGEEVRCCDLVAMQN